MTQKYFARLNGRNTTAYKMGQTWLVGGDKIGKGDSASIAITKDDRTAWYSLRGAVLVFEDYLTETESRLRQEALKQVSA